MKGLAWEDDAVDEPVFLTTFSSIIYHLILNFIVNISDNAFYLHGSLLITVVDVQVNRSFWSDDVENKEKSLNLPLNYF